MQEIRIRSIGSSTLSRLLYGAQVSAWIAFSTLAFALSVGTAIRVISGYFGGRTDSLIMMINAALLALGLMAALGASSSDLIVALGIAHRPAVVRVVRSTVMSERQLEFVEASTVIGNSDLTTMERHVLPNAFPPITVLASMMFCSIILSEAALGFLGLGVPPPAPSWGSLPASQTLHHGSGAAHSAAGLMFFESRMLLGAKTCRPEVGTGFGTTTCVKTET